MQVPSETSRGADYFKDIIESGKTLKVSGPVKLSQSNSYLFEITGFGKRWDICLTREQIDDLPGTKEYHVSALALARVLDCRFRNVDPNLYIAHSGRLLQIIPEWPAFQMMNDARTSWIAATGTVVHVNDFLTHEVAKCVLKITTLQAMPGAGPDPFIRPAAIINSLRSAVDSGAIKFYATDTAHPDEGQLVNLSCGPYVSDPVSLPDFLLNKVWSLGFKAGRKDTSVWISDPWDATYLGSSTSELQQSAAVLDAQEKIVLDESHEFASVGRTLLAQEGPKQLATVAATPQFRTALGAYTLGSPLGEGGSGKVFRAVDEDGSEHALKYLKPEGQTSSEIATVQERIGVLLEEYSSQHHHGRRLGPRASE